jgi:hypothetical protein
MRTIKTYIKGAPFYIASASRHVGFAKFPVADKTRLSGGGYLNTVVHIEGHD